MKTVRLTMAQALVRFLENQYIAYDGVEHPFVEGVIMLPGHGNVVGLGQALRQETRRLKVWQGKNEQGMAILLLQPRGAPGRTRPDGAGERGAHLLRRELRRG